MSELIGHCEEIHQVIRPKTVKGEPELMVIAGDVWNPLTGEMMDPGVVSELKIREAHVAIDPNELPYR